MVPVRGGGMGTSRVFRFSTDQVEPKDRLAVWREVVGRQHSASRSSPIRHGICVPSSKCITSR